MIPVPHFGGGFNALHTILSVGGELLAVGITLSRRRIAGFLVAGRSGFSVCGLLLVDNGDIGRWPDLVEECRRHSEGVK